MCVYLFVLPTRSSWREKERERRDSRPFSEGSAIQPSSSKQRAIGIPLFVFTSFAWRVKTHLNNRWTAAPLLLFWFFSYLLIHLFSWHFSLSLFVLWYQTRIYFLRRFSSSSGSTVKRGENVVWHPAFFELGMFSSPLFLWARDWRGCTQPRNHSTLQPQLSRIAENEINRRYLNNQHGLKYTSIISMNQL